MLAIGKTALSLYSSASQFKTALSQLSQWISYLSSTDRHSLQRLLARLERRIEAIEQPLRYCMLWARDKGSCTDRIILQTRNLLEKVKHFVILWNFRENGNANFGNSENFGNLSNFDNFETDAENDSKSKVERISDKIAEFLQDLDFSMNALSLSMSVIATSWGGEGVCVSSSALLRASSRIKEVLNTSKGTEQGEKIVICSLKGILLEKKKRNWEISQNNSNFEIIWNFGRKSFELHVSSDEDYGSWELSSGMRVGLINAQEKGLSNDSKCLDRVFSWETKFLNKVQKEFVFVVNLSHLSNSQTLSPLQVFYCLRLCVYENTIAPKHCDKGDDKVLFHLRISDEELWSLFGEVQ